MAATMEKVIVDFGGDMSAKNVIQTTIKALKQSRQEKKANEFQVEVVSGKPMMDVVKSYVTIA